ENEQSIVDFLGKHSEFELLPLANETYFSAGQPGWANPQENSLQQTARLWPHHLEGEGHFIAKLRKLDETESGGDRTVRKKKEKTGKSSAAGAGRKEAIAAWHSFAEELCPALAKRLDQPQAFILFGEQLYYLPASLDLAGVKVVRPGYHLGAVKKNRFEPSHALALTLRTDQVKRYADYAAEDQDLLRFLKGETLTREANNGWTLVTVDGYSLGWGKQVD
ncbi:RsmF rRNA methyltransferase first C-terminal domain-containing protein, partial [Frankia sp. Cpl3]|nr:RsmF rRNA methyltransferase first C-terminal domain-containing protein [Frankia sp. Cpl3]